MNEKAIVADILLYIEKNLNEDLSLNCIERELCYSKFYINRLFAKETGCTIYKYIQMRRLTEAARQLVETDKPIVEISQDAHYNSQQAFTLAFHKVYLCAPQEYRMKGEFIPRQPRIIIDSCLFIHENSCRMMGGKLAA